MSILRNLASAPAERRGADPLLPWGNSYIPQNWETGRVLAGVPMNDDAALSVSTVMTCVALIADAVATLPLEARKKTSDRSVKIIDPPPPLVGNPWPEGTIVDFLTQLMVSLLLRGNFYGQIVDRDSAGYATTIMPIHPDRVIARRDERTGQRIYRIAGVPVPTEDVLHIPAILTPQSFIGLSPVEYQRQSWAVAAAAAQYGGNFYANSANPSGALLVPGDLSEEETLELARAWKQAHQGIGNAQYPAVLTNGVTWQQVSVTPEQAQFLATRAYQRDEIISFFRIPPHMVAVVDRTPVGTLSVEAMSMQFVANTLAPWLVRIEQYFGKLLRPSQTCKFDLSSRLRGDTLQRFQAYQIARNGGWLNVDEIRGKEEMPDVPDGSGKNFLQPMNMAPLGYDPTAGAPAPPTDSGVGQDGTGGAVGKQAG